MKVFCFIFLVPLFLFGQLKEISINKNWNFRKAGNKDWLPAQVPGTVHTDLYTNRLIGDPFTSKENELQWVENSDWEYQCTFTIDKSLLQEELTLVFEGLDTYADVFLNGNLLLKADNMFRSWSADVKKLVRPGKNELLVKFTSALTVGKDLAKKVPYCLPEEDRVFTRKAQYQYGWDFAPRFVTCGIWKHVKLISWKAAKLNHVQVFVDSLTDSRAVLYFSPEVDCVEKGNYEFVLSCKEDKRTNSILNTPMGMGRQDYGLTYAVLNPSLWWCRGMGAPSLYHFVLELRKDGHLIDSKEIRVGIRTIELVRDKDTLGESFYFKLNGKPVFMKGANLVPPDVFLSRTAKPQYANLVDKAVSANMNMLRVWGGGAYCDDDFYDLCDANGILVWQDLMFACAMYPGDESFVSNVSKEVEEQVKRLSVHPCLALWCGNNESDEGWKNWGWQKQFNYSKQDSTAIYHDYLSLFSEKVPGILDACYQGAKYNYVPSSPQFGWGRKESMTSGDSHYWGVWWGMEPFEMYKKKVGRFMSEYGFQGLPSVSCVQKFHPYEIKPGTISLSAMQKHPKGFETIDTYLERDYKKPNGFEDYVYVSQLLQARGLQMAIEAQRRAKPYCMGSLYWQLNDCWPGITWSSIDFAGVPKASWYAAKRSFKDILVSFADEKDSICVYITSDYESLDLITELSLTLCDLSGKPAWNKTVPVKIGAGTSRKYYTVTKQIMGDRKKEKMVLKASLDTRDGSLNHGTAYYYFVAPKDLALQKAEVAMVRSAGKIELSTNTLAKDVYLDMGAGITFSDNFFDLLPGEKKVIVIKGKADKEAKIQVKSLYDIK